MDATGDALPEADATDGSPEEDPVRAMWRRGDYADVGDRIAAAGVELVRAVGVAGLDVLDVATGTGNTAVAAARAGGRVTAVERVPELLDVARGRAAAEFLDVDWVEGHLEDLGQPTAAFDRVLSTFGVMFAPDPVRAARELARVCRPGGLIGVTAWTSDSVFAAVDAVLRSYVPEEFAGNRPAISDWAERERLDSLFAGLGVTWDVRVERFGIPFPSREDAVRFFETKAPPVLMARDLIAAGGGWDDVRRELAVVFGEFGHPGQDGGLVLDAEYALAVGRRR